MMEPVLLSAVQRAAGRRGQSLITTHSQGRSPANLIAEFQSLNVAGVLLDNIASPVLPALSAAGIPAVVISDWATNLPADCVVQDDYLGGMLLAEHLTRLGCRNLAWFGVRPGLNRHSRDRFNGFAGSLAMQGLSLRPEHICAPTSDDCIVEIAKQMLKRKSRPDGVVALWLGHASAIVTAARELGLVLGKDLHLVGWCSEDVIETLYFPMFREAVVAPAITWSPLALAEAALVQLETRQRNSATAYLRINVPVRLETFSQYATTTPPHATSTLNYTSVRNAKFQQSQDL